MGQRWFTGWWGVVLDTPDTRSLAEFYSRLLGWEIAKAADSTWAAIGQPGGTAYLAFQRSPEFVRPVWPPAEGEQQMMLHLDIGVDDLETAVAHAVEAGATVAEHQPQQEVRVMLDPDGHPFCLYIDKNE